MLKRLTEKGIGYKTLEGKARYLATINSISKAELRNLYCTQYDELQVLEDVEENIGLPLAFLFSLINETIFVIDREHQEVHIDEVSINGITKIGNMYYFVGNQLCNSDSNPNSYLVRVKQDKMLYFFTQKEAENELEEMKTEPKIFMYRPKNPRKKREMIMRDTSVNLSQLKGMKHEVREIIYSNCDTKIFLCGKGSDKQKRIVEDDENE